MGFGDSAGGVLEGFRMANQDLMAKHQQLASDAIAQAQQQHQQQELDNQTTAENNLQSQRSAQNFMQLLGQFKDYQASGGTGAAFAGMLRPLGNSDKNIGDFLDTVKNQGQGQSYLDSVAAAKAQMTADQFKAWNAHNDIILGMRDKMIEHLTTNNPNYLDPNIARNAAELTYPTTPPPGGTQSQGGQNAPSSSVFPNNHQQNASDAVAKASPGGPALGTMTMPSGASSPNISAMWQQMQGQQSPQSTPNVPPQQSSPPAGGVAAPPALGSSPPGAGVPQSMVNPTSPITGDPNAANAGSSMPNDGTQAPNGGTLPPGLPAPAPPPPIQAINPNPYDGISAAFKLKEAAQAQKDEQERLATEIQQRTLDKMNADAPYLNNTARLNNIKLFNEVKAQQAAADQANQLFPLKLKQTQADIGAANASSWTQVQNARTNAARLDFEKVKDAADRADKTGGKMTASEITGAYSNARQLLVLQKDLASQMNANRAAVAAARRYLDPKLNPVPDENAANYAEVMRNKSESNSSITGTYNATTHLDGPSPLDAQYSVLESALGQTQDLLYKNQVILNKIGPQPTNTGGKPDKVYTSPTSGNTIPGAPPGTVGNGKNQLLMPPTPGAKGLAKVSPPTGKVDYSKIPTKDLLQRLIQKVK